MIKKLKIRNKLMLAFFLTLCITMIMVAFSFMRLTSLYDSSHMLSDTAIPSIQSTTKLQYTLSSIRRLETQAMLADETERKSLNERIVKQRVDALKILDLLKKSVGGDSKDKSYLAYTELLNKLEKTMAIYILENDKVLDLVKNESIDEAKKILFSTSREAYNNMIKSVDEVLVSNDEFAKFQSIVVDESFEKGKRALWIGLALAIVTSLLLAWIISRMITNPLLIAVNASKEISEGNLTVDIKHNYLDETGDLLNSLELMKQNLVSLVSQVKIGSESVLTASSEIAQGNNDLSARTEQQASALEETSASMMELNSNVDKNALSANSANQLALESSKIVKEGGDLVGQIVVNMQGINQSSKKITDIISVIDGIAFQTNILALNAAVEAARAGEQGRGFAVVASEVRTLAGRSAEAAKEIKNLIGASEKEVAKGNVLVEKAGTIMSEAVISIKKVTDLMGEISMASNEQKLGVSQVTEAVTQMDQVTQQNAALVEEMAAAATSLSHQANDLVKVVEVFKTN